jgi:hypothetical protein
LVPSSSARGRVAVSECSEPSDWESNPHSLSRSRYYARRFTTVLGKRHMKIIAAKVLCIQLHLCVHDERVQNA